MWRQRAADEEALCQMLQGELAALRRDFKQFLRVVMAENSDARGTFLWNQLCIFLILFRSCFIG